MGIEEVIDAAGTAARNAANAGANAASNIGEAWRSGLPSAAAAEVPANTGSLRYLADSARSIGGAVGGLALRAAPGVAGFLSGSGLTASPPTPVAVGDNNQPGTDVPRDVSPDTKAWMQAPNTSPTPQREPASPFMEYMRDSRDGIRSALGNLGWDSLRGNLQALPGGSALSAVGNLAGVGARTSRMAGMLTEGAMLDKAGSGIGKGLVASGFINPPTPDPVAAFAARNTSAGGPVSSAAAKTSQRIAGVADRNPDLFNLPPNAAREPGSPAQVQGVTPPSGTITKLTGGNFGSPMFTDDPVRALQEYGRRNAATPQNATTITGADGQPQTYFPSPVPVNAGPLKSISMGSVEDAGRRVGVMPSTAAADRNFLSAALQRHVASGDLERALATADPNNPEHQIAIGNMLRQHQQSQAQAAQSEPLQRMMMQALESAMKPQSDIRAHAFSGPMRGGRGGASAEAGGPNMQGIAGLIGQYLAANKAQPEQSPMMQALAQSGVINRQQQDQQGNTIELLAKQAKAQSASIMAKLQEAYAAEKDPAKREAIGQQLQTLSGRFEKSSTGGNRVIALKVPTGELDRFGQPIETHILYDQESGKMVDPRTALVNTQPSREQIIARAKASVEKGAKKEEVNARAMQLYGFAPL